MLGYTGSVHTFMGSPFGNGMTWNQHFFGLIACDGDETTILDCDIDERENCNYNENAGVECYQDFTQAEAELGCTTGPGN